MFDGSVVPADQSLKADKLQVVVTFIRDGKYVHVTRHAHKVAGKGWQITHPDDRVPARHRAAEARISEIERSISEALGYRKNIEREIKELKRRHDADAREEKKVVRELLRVVHKATRILDEDFAEAQKYLAKLREEFPLFAPVIIRNL